MPVMPLCQTFEMKHSGTIQETGEMYAENLASSYFTVTTMLDSTINHQDDLQHPLQNNRKKVSVEQNGDRSFELGAFGHAHRHFENVAMHRAVFIVSRIPTLHCHRKSNKMAITSSVIVSIDAVGTVR